MVEPGRRELGGRYALTELIASGGMGQVWRGTDELLGRPVAVKVLRSEYTGDPTFRARFRAEAQHAAGLNHPNIAAVFDYGEACAEDGSGETLAYLVMELVEGEPLSAVLHREGRLAPERTLALLEQTASALAQAHRAGLVHRDVKPGNILVRADGSVKITDFGIAWSAGSVPLTRTGQVIGTPQYLAPEVAEGLHASPASDVYALGLVGYECLAGHPAFDGDNAVTIALKQVREDPEPLSAELPPGLRTLIRRALSKDPGVRMADGAEFVAAIGDLRAGRRPVEPPPTRAVPAVPALDVARAVHGDRSRRAPATRRRGAAVLVPLLALLLGAGAAAAVLTVLPGDPPPATEVAGRTTDGEAVVLDAGEFVGRPVDEAALTLAALGLVVDRRPEVTGAADPGSVTAVDPAGVPLEPGEDVLLVYAVPPADDSPAPPSQAPAPEAPAGEETPDGPAVTTAPEARPEPGADGGATPVDDPRPDPTGARELPGGQVPEEPAPTTSTSTGSPPVEEEPPPDPSATPTSTSTAPPSPSGTADPGGTTEVRERDEDRVPRTGEG
ncbi:serine/threonine protein kinase [Geodermatophilus marinus]|nr:serine/threonine protein kinase [Geodermatophilus sp. LHW52908]